MTEKRTLFFKLACLGCLLLTVACTGRDQYDQPISGELPASIIPYYAGAVGAPQYEDLLKSSKQNVSVRVGMLLPLTGKSKRLGEELRNAGMLAQFDLANDQLVLQFYDTKGTPEGAREAFEKAKADHVQLILGPVFADEVKAVRKSSGRIPIISFTSDTDSVGDGVYTMALLLTQQTERIIRHACDQKKTRLAIMAPDNKAGDIAIETARKTAAACGMEVTRLAVYNPTFINFEPYVLSVLPDSFAGKKKYADEKKKEKKTEKEKNEIPVAEQLDFDALFIADDGNRLKSIAALFGLYDVTPREVMFLGMSTWYEPSLTNEGALLGGRFSALPSSGFETFSAKYKETYGRTPVRLASLAYDAVALASVLPQTLGLTEKSLTNARGFIGTDGLFRLRKDGSSERLLGVLQIAGKNNFRVVEEPAASFEEEAFMKEHMSDIQILNAYREQQRLARERLRQEMERLQAASETTPVQE